MVSGQFQSPHPLETHMSDHNPPQNQRQKSKAQQQATSQPGSSRVHGLAQRPPGPYQVFSYDSLRYEPPTRPYTSPYPYASDEPRHAHMMAPAPRRFSRHAYHRHGTSSLSYSVASTSGRHEQPPGGYVHARYPMEDVAFAHSPPSYYEHRRSPELGGSGSPEVSRHPVRDDTLPPIWPENDPETSRGSMSNVLNPVASSRPGPSRQTLLPSGLPPPQPLEPTPLWSHPHTNPRYMRPLPPASDLPSLLGSLNRGRARSDPPVGSLPSPPREPTRPSLGLGLVLTGIRPSHNPGEGARGSLDRTEPAEPIGLRTHHRQSPRLDPTTLRESIVNLAESSHHHMSGSSANQSRRSSRDSQGDAHN
jgi:hypothetical protein